MGNGLYKSVNDLASHKLLTAQEEFQLSRQFLLGNQIKAQRKVMALKLGREITDIELSKVLGLSSADHVNYLINNENDTRLINLYTLNISIWGAMSQK